MAEKFIELHHVNKHYGGVHALKDIDFDLNMGEVHCLVGKNGCGKSTMIKIVSGVIKPDEGSEIILCGKKMKSVSPQISMDCGVRVIYQDLSLFPNLTVAENIAFNQHTDKAFKGVNWKRINETAKNTLDMMHINLDLSADVSSLSIADRQLVAIARALATNPKVLLCDEATSALDPTTTNSILSLIRKINEELGITVIIITHQMSVVESVCRHVAIIDGGIIAEQGAVGEVFSRPKSAAARRLVFPEGSEDYIVSHREGERCIRVAFDGADTTGTPVIAKMAVEEGIEANIVYASTRSLDGRTYGSMLLGVSGGDDAVKRAVAYLTKTSDISAEEVTEDAE